MTKGLPASGKTTWAKTLVTKKGYKRINKDDLRAMLDNGKFTRGNENLVLAIRNSIIEQCFERRLNIVVDDTNLAPKHESTLSQMVDNWNNKNKLKKMQYQFEVKDFTDVPVDVCIKRDLTRCPSVGEEVIKGMYNDFLKPSPEVVEHNGDLGDVIICDLDGTLALFGDKNPYVRDFENDEVNEVVRSLLRSSTSSPSGSTIHIPSPKVIVVSGRSGAYVDKTTKWLEENDINYFALFMRKEGDNRKDSIVKREIYDNKIRGKFNVKYVLDDRNQVVEMWRSLGLTVLQVADGDF